MKRVDVSYNNPGRKSALSELLRHHSGLRSIGVIESEPMSRMERTFHLNSSLSTPYFTLTTSH